MPTQKPRQNRSRGLSSLLSLLVSLLSGCILVTYNSRHQNLVSPFIHLCEGKINHCDDNEQKHAEKESSTTTRRKFTGDLVIAIGVVVLTWNSRGENELESG